MATQRLFSVSVAGVVVGEDGRILVIQRSDNGRWEAPGGVLEVGESFEQCAEREVLGETGLAVTAQRLTGVYLNRSANVTALVYRCVPAASTEPVITDETSAVRWVNLDEVDRLMDPAFAVRITDAFAPYPASRSHDGVNLWKNADDVLPRI